MKCENCKTEKEKLLNCAACKKVFYCSIDCQKDNWKIHKKKCTFKKPKPKTDEYEIKEEIGQGNFTKIHLAYNKKHKKTVALKIAEKSRLIKLHKEKELFIEKHCLTKLKDVESVVNIYETFQDDLNIYISMEYIEGKELWEICNIFGFKIKKLAQYYFYKIISSIKEIHDLEIVHRDLKPENIMITKNKKNIKIIDFGSGKDIKNNVFSKGNSSTGRKYFEHFMGTPNYMPPECVRNKFSNKSSDVYSLGCLYYNLITGFPPFIGGSEYLIFKDMFDKKLPVFYNFLFDEFEIDLITKMMEHDAEKRPNLKEVLEIIEEWGNLDFDDVINNKNDKEIFFLDFKEKNIGKEFKFKREEIYERFKIGLEELEKKFGKEEGFKNLKLEFKYFYQQCLHYYDLKKFEYPVID